MVQPLPGFLHLCLDVCSPCQVLGDVYTEVLEATHPLHRGPTDHKRSVGLLLSLPEVYNQLFGFAHVQRETVVLAPWCKCLFIFKRHLPLVLCWMCFLFPRDASTAVSKLAQHLLAHLLGYFKNEKDLSSGSQKRKKGGKEETWKR